jgi:uncharacterized DUF497 family protein
MDVEFELRGVRFRWNADKAAQNMRVHGVAFEQAAQSFLRSILSLCRRLAPG